MSLFDSASVVITPSGYKEDKLYSIKPTDGSGDLVVTRATTATRVNSAGLIEVTPYNLLTYSQEFNDASWGKINSSITANATTAPDGTLTADKLVENSSNANHLVQKTVSATDSVYTFSVFAKKSERNWVVLRSVNASLQNVKAWFNIDAGTIGTLENGATANITNVGNGWYKLEMTIPSFSTGFEFRVSTSTGNNVDSYTGDGTSGLFIWGAQLVQGTSAKEYFPTTDRLNVPRIDYTNGSCPSILVEPQRTNKYPYSEQFDNVFWLKNNLTVTANNTTAPDGNNTADKIQDTIGTNIDHIFNYLMSFTSGTAYTASFYVKNVDINYFCIKFMTNAFGSIKDVIFNIQNGTVTRQDSGITASVVNMGNGWYRCIATATATVTTSTLYGLYVGITNSPTSTAYTSTSIKSAYLWGAQLEAGSYPTSYIPTVASSVTRNADVISKTGISSLIGQTEGTIFVEEIYDANVANVGGVDDTLVSLSDGTTNNLISIFHYGNIGGGVDRKVLFFIRLSNVNQAAFYSSSLPSGTYKIAMAYKNNDVAFYINGVQLGTDTSATIPATSALTLVDPVTVLAATKTVNFKNIALFKTRLSNTELATLTTI